MATKVAQTKQQRRGQRTHRSAARTPREPPFTWVDHRRTVLTNEERVTLLGFVHHTPAALPSELQLELTA
jgi:hypothetical protein